jgi:hypothetical protein
MNKAEIMSVKSRPWQLSANGIIRDAAGILNAFIF